VGGYLQVVVGIGNLAQMFSPLYGNTTEQFWIFIEI
jgi:hypothetical protein